MPHKSRFSSLALAAFSTLAITACGGTQGDLDAAPDPCGRVTSDLSPAALESAVACHRRENTARSAERCRDVIDVAAVATPAALRDTAACVLQARSRNDGVWLADMMLGVQEDGHKLIALADSFADGFDPAVHGVTWTASIEEDTQQALSGVLRRVDPEARDAMVSLALAYDVQPLATLASPYLSELGDNPAALAYAQQLADSDEPLDEQERAFVISAGAWTAEDALDCFARDLNECRDWEGASPLAALAEVPVETLEIGGPSTPNAALRALRSGDVDPASVRGITRVLGGLEYSSRDAMIGPLMFEFTDPSNDEAFRAAIASEATEPMCRYDVISGLFLRTHDDENRFEDATGPWATFIVRCDTLHWNAEDRFAAASAGSWMGVPFATWETVLATLDEVVGDASCDEIRAMGREAQARTPWMITNDMSMVVAANIGGDACAALFEEDLEDIKDDGDAHPEARLGAWAWLVAQDDDACSSRGPSRLLEWYNEDYDQGPGPYAEHFASVIEAACD